MNDLITCLLNCIVVIHFTILYQSKKSLSAALSFCIVKKQVFTAFSKRKLKNVNIDAEEIEM